MLCSPDVDASGIRTITLLASRSHDRSSSDVHIGPSHLVTTAGFLPLTENYRDHGNE
jgi:hypothetical protein